MLNKHVLAKRKINSTKIRKNNKFLLFLNYLALNGSSERPSNVPEVIGPETNSLESLSPNTKLNSVILLQLHDPFGTKCQAQM